MIPGSAWNMILESHESSVFLHQQHLRDFPSPLPESDALQIQNPQCEDAPSNPNKAEVALAEPWALFGKQGFGIAVLGEAL